MAKRTFVSLALAGAGFAALGGTTAAQAQQSRHDDSHLSSAPRKADIIIPPDCLLNYYWNGTTTQCSERAHQAWVQCGDGNWYHGEWANKMQISGVRCPNALAAIDHSMSYPD